jgi:phosphinothricin acetyltransferase
MSRAIQKVMGVRPLTSGDISAVTSIFNEVVSAEETTCDFQPRTEEQIKSWLTGDLPKYESFVFEKDNEVLGWAAITRYHEREAYSPTTELVTFVRRGARNKGIGRELMRLVLRRAREIEFHSAVCIVFPEPAHILDSVQQLGFQELGRLHDVFPTSTGFRDVVLFQLFLQQ